MWHVSNARVGKFRVEGILRAIARCVAMAMETSASARIRQGLLGFDIDPTGGEDQVTARAGLPLVLETMRALGLHEVVEQHVRILDRAVREPARRSPLRALRELPPSAVAVGFSPR